MTPRRKRLLAVLAILGGIGLATAVAIKAFDNNLSYFYDPSQVADGKAPSDKSFRIGGMVTQGSVARTPGTLEVHFVLTDFAHSVPVSYTGLLPDLFREGQGVVAEGVLDQPGRLRADTVLAKHDERYMPREVVDALKKQGRWREGEVMK